MPNLNSTGVTFSDATRQPSAFVGSKSQVFAASGTFTAPAGITSVKVTCIGGGGGTNGNYLGGYGGIAIGYYTVVPGVEVTVTVGAGGASVTSGSSSGGAGGSSSFGSFCSATGGSGGNTSNTRTMGVGTSGTLTNNNVNYGVSTFTGVATRFPSNTANSLSAVAWSPTIVDATTNLLGRPCPGARGAINAICCVGTYYAGAVGGAVLVEW